MSPFKAVKLGVAGLLAGAFATAVYDYGFNTQTEVEQVTFYGLEAYKTYGNVVIETKSGHIYDSLTNDDPPAGMFLRRDGREFEFTYTGGIANKLFGWPRNPVAVRVLPAPGQK